MNETEVTTTGEAAFYLASEVLNEYHGFPVVQRADFGINSLYAQLNGQWFRLDISAVPDGSLADDLDHLQPSVIRSKS